jgi:hypothetical protein
MADRQQVLLPLVISQTLCLLRKLKFGRALVRVSLLQEAEHLFKLLLQR